MALDRIAIPADAARDGRARALVPFVSSWPKHTLKVAYGSFEPGTTFRRAPGSRGEKYLVNAVACECEDYQKAGQICKHIRAICMWEAQVAAPKPRPTAEALWGRTCEVGGCTDDQVSYQPYCKRHALSEVY